MPKKTRGLARGLDALLPELDTTAPGAGQEIAIGDIDPILISPAIPSPRRVSSSWLSPSRIRAC